MKAIKWSTQVRKVKDLIPYDKNPRKITDEQKEQLTKSLKKFNLVEIPAINTDGKIIAGHQRVTILIALGRGKEEIDVRVPNRKLTEAEFKEYNLRSNKNTGEWDFDFLKEFGKDMLGDVGFSAADIDTICIDMDGLDDSINLPSGAKADLEQITFTVTGEQMEQVKAAMAGAHEMGDYVDTGNENKNGNAIARICEVFNGQS